MGYSITGSGSDNNNKREDEETMIELFESENEDEPVIELFSSSSSATHERDSDEVVIESYDSSSNGDEPQHEQEVIEPSCKNLNKVVNERKEFSIVMKRIDFIERAVEKGEKSVTLNKIKTNVNKDSGDSSSKDELEVGLLIFVIDS